MPLILRALFIFLFLFSTTYSVNAAPIAVSEYIPKLKLLCKALQEDGRADTAAVIVDSNPVKDPTCLACKALFGSLKEICREKKIKSKTPIEPKKKQREPNILVLHYGSELATQMSENEKNKFELYKAMKKLMALLSGPFPGRAEGEVEYFDILNAYIEAGFSEVEAELKEKAATEAEDEKKNKQVNDIFD